MKTRLLIVIVLGTIAFLVFSVSSSLKYDDGKTPEIISQNPTSEFKEVRWNWHGPTSFLLGEKISFSVSRMDKFCDDVFVAKIVNLDRSKIFWQESGKVECSDIDGGKISKLSFPIEKPIVLDTSGTYIVIADFADFHGYPMLHKKINVEVPDDAMVVVTIPLGASNAELMKTFEPNDVIVSLGINNTIKWINQDEVGSALISNDAYTGFASPYLYPNDSWHFTFTEPGVFEYHSIPHPWMNGKITVIQNEN